MVYRMAVPIWFGLLLVSGCDRTENSGETTSESSLVRCQTVSSQDQAKLVASVAELKIGDSSETVESLLGRPGDVGHLATKPSNRIMGTEYIYFVKKCGNDPHVGWTDDYVRLTFRLNDRLGRVEGIRVGGVTNRSDEQPTN